jgi:aldehyde:ferredoxin oxidoreductase
MHSIETEEFYGFIGKLLKVNLTNLSISEEKLNFEYGCNFLGGAGYACRYLFDKIDKDLNPLSPENELMIMTGPLCGTIAPSSGRFVICSKSPYTELWGESNCGGSFGPELKKAGYDGIVISGKAKNPKYIKIINNKIDILDATNLWGKGIKETQTRLKKQADNLKAKVLCIGQAGENLIKFSTINSEGRSAGRTGMGAIMGSKKLKAIILEGDLYSPNIADPPEFKRITKKILSFILKAQNTKTLRNFGTSAGVVSAHSYGDLPIKYWNQGEWNKIFNISGEKLKKKFVIKRKSCYGCPVGCGGIIEIKGKKSSFGDYEGPEYETIAGFGSMILNDNLESISIANNLCNDYGLDTISTSSVIAFLYNLYNKNLISKSDVDGLELNWGNNDSMLALIKKIAFREGVGDMLAEGSDYVGEKFNISKQDIATVNKLEVPYHDLRACYGMSITYAFSPRGPCHTTSDAFKVLRKENEIDFSSINIRKINLFSNDKKLVEYTANLQDYRALYSSLITCFFSNPLPEDMIQLVESLLGFDLNIKKMMKLGERIFNLKRLFNIKMGITPKDDNIPELLLKPLNNGPVDRKTPNFQRLKQFYYNYRKWDPITGKPKNKKLKQLGLEKLNLKLKK